MSSVKTSFPKNRIKIVLVENIHAAGVQMLRDEGYQVETLAGSPEPAKLHKLLKDAHIIGIRSKTDLTPEAFNAAERLLGVGCFCIGTNQVNLDHACSIGLYSGEYGGRCR
jgi:D-3-phosphoglycerate dehydrogenase